MSFIQNTNLTQVKYNTAHTVTTPYYTCNNTELAYLLGKLSDAHAAMQSTKECVRSVYPSLLFSPSYPSSLWRGSMRRGLGGWRLSLNDPVYFEKALISARALMLTKESQNPY